MRDCRFDIGCKCQEIHRYGESTTIYLLCIRRPNDCRNCETAKENELTNVSFISLFVKNLCGLLCGLFFNLFRPTGSVQLDLLTHRLEFPFVVVLTRSMSIIVRKLRNTNQFSRYNIIGKIFPIGLSIHIMLRCLIPFFSLMYKPHSICHRICGWIGIWLHFFLSCFVFNHVRTNYVFR